MANILVAVGDAVDRKTLADAFRLTGNGVVEAADAGGCLEILEKQPPEALVLDPRLPGLESSQLLRHLRRNPAFASMRVSLLAHSMDSKQWEFLGRQFFDLVVEQSGIEAAGVLAAPGPSARSRKGAKTTRLLKKTLEGKDDVKRILVVEDEPTYCILLGTEFQAYGWGTLGADCAETGLDILKNEKVDAVLSDINLPGMMGHELAFKVRKEFPRVKIVLMTGMPKDRYPKVPKDVPILPKPISVKELMQAMRFIRQG